MNGIIIYDYPTTMKLYNYIFLYSLFCSLFINQEDSKSLRAKIAMLEEELRKSRQDSSEYHHLVRNLENVLCECLSDLAICAYAITIFIYSHSPALLIILVMIYAGGKRSERSGTTREAKGTQTFVSVS